VAGEGGLDVGEPGPGGGEGVGAPERRVELFAGLGDLGLLTADIE